MVQSVNIKVIIIGNKTVNRCLILFYMFLSRIDKIRKKLYNGYMKNGDKMKLITFAVPCYNSENYMEHCLKTLLTAKEDIEIIIIDDGSKDNTGKIADEYASQYPDIVKVVHQENGGHGEGVNQGIRHATGVYYKVVDSDDWLDEKALNQLLKKIKQFVSKKELVDLILFNYVYEKENEQKVIHYKNVFPINRIFTWQETKKFKLHQNILMHSVCYRTQLLKDCKIELPKHTFYVDNIFVYYPLTYVKNMYYMDINLYRYFIGREDQSVNENIMIKRIDQQYLVTYQMIHFYHPYEIAKENKNLAHYLVHYLSMMVTICSILTILSKDKNNYNKRKNLWADLKKYDVKLYRHIRYRSLATLTMLPRWLVIPCYRVIQKKYKFN